LARSVDRCRVILLGGGGRSVSTSSSQIKFPGHRLVGTLRWRRGAADMCLRRSSRMADVGFPGEFFEASADFSSGDFVLQLQPRHVSIFSSVIGKHEEGLQELSVGRLATQILGCGWRLAALFFLRRRRRQEWTVSSSKERGDLPWLSSHIGKHVAVRGDTFSQAHNAAWLLWHFLGAWRVGGPSFLSPMVATATTVVRIGGRSDGRRKGLEGTSYYFSFSRVLCAKFLGELSVGDTPKRQ
jgi:hypothetical protein